MKRKTLKKALSAFLSLLMCMMTLLSISTPVFAATTVDAYMVDFPRDGDSNYSATAWGHSATSLMGGWRFLNSKYTTVHSIGTYNGQVSYCIEPGIGQNAGDTLSHKDETFWENYPSHLNPTISPDTIKVLLGRIMQYGYQGNVSTSWRSQNASDAAALSHIIATQLLVWETVVGERDASFNKVDPSGYGKSAVWSYIRDEHPLRSQIRSYYNSMAASVQSHAEIPSFCARSIGSARSYELKYDGTRYTVTLTDTNGVLSNFSFSSSEPGISFSRSGNRLTITSDTPIAGDIRVSASKTNGVRSGVVVWTDGNKGAGIQDVVTYGENVSDPVSAYLRLEMEALGVMHLVKTSEDGVVAGISFTISGNGITKTVTTGRDGTIDVSELMAGTYTVTEADIERYTPQTSQQVTIVGGQTSTVTFNNVLKRGALEVTKTSEDGFVEGVKFRLYGKSLSGLNVDEYAVTDSTGVAKFRNVLIGGPYTIEEVDTAVRYVIPDPQSVSIQWNRVAERSFANILKKFTVTVTKTDAETGTPQGDATLSGAKYGIYKGGKLVDVYYTDANGQFTSKEYICDTDWTIREMEPSEGYLLDTTEHAVGAAPGQYTFRYKETEVLHGISFDCAKNGMTAIVGPSGSGKSTIARLIASFWEAESGDVRIGGVDVRNIPLPQIMELVSYVSQDNFLFHLSIRENIRIGKLEATDAEIEAAAKKASCHDFIAALPEGYDTLAGDAGSHLSGGERQRIAIARAILKNSPIVVLDEATAFTDPENEAVIQASIAGLVAGKTLIVIAHRLSTITKADKILVMDKGNVAAEGTHEELLETSNLYKELWKAHMQGKDTAEEVA